MLCLTTQSSLTLKLGTSPSHSLPPSLLLSLAAFETAESTKRLWLHACSFVVSVPYTQAHADIKHLKTRNRLILTQYWISMNKCSFPTELSLYVLHSYWSHICITRGSPCPCLVEHAFTQCSDSPK